MENNAIKAKYAIVRNKEFNMFTGEIELPVTVIKIFTKEYSYTGLRPISDNLIKDAEIYINGPTVKIKGKKVLFSPSLGTYKYGRRYKLIDEVVDAEKWTPEKVVEFVKYHSANKLILKPEDIKIGYDGFWNWLKRKKTYYLITTKDIISKLGHLEPHAILQKGKTFYTQGWSQTTLLTDFSLESNAFRVEHVD